MSRSYEGDFLTYAKANALKAARRTYEMIDELTADKAAVVAEKNFNMVQILQNRPTAITQTQDEIAVKFFYYLKSRVDWDLETIIEAVKIDYPNFEPKMLGDGK